jgi:hypothetical protein
VQAEQIINNAAAEIEVLGESQRIVDAQAGVHERAVRAAGYAIAEASQDIPVTAGPVDSPEEQVREHMDDSRTMLRVYSGLMGDILSQGTIISKDRGASIRERAIRTEREKRRLAATFRNNALGKKKFGDALARGKFSGSLGSEARKKAYERQLNRPEDIVSRDDDSTSES